MFYGRRLFKAVIFFCLGDIISLLCPDAFFYIGFIIAIVSFGAIAFFRLHKYVYFQKYIVFFAIGLLLGQLFSSYILAPFRNYENTTIEISGYVIETDKINDSITLKITDSDIIPFSFKAKLFGDADQIKEIKKGDTLNISVDCGAIENKLYLIADRTFIQGRIISAEKCYVIINTFDKFYLDTRAFLEEALRNSLGNGDEFALANGILIGDQSEISVELKDAFKATGLSHFLSISGLHFSLIVFMSYFVLLRLCANRKAACIVSIIIIFLYMPIPSFTPSVVRAAFISLLLFVTKLTKLKSDTVTSMSLSLFIILLFNPAAILSVGLQLSYCATFGIIYSSSVSPEIALENRHASLPKRFLRYILLSVKVSTLALIFTTPIVIFTFGSFSLFSPLFNLILSPLFTIALTSSIIIAFLSALFPLLSLYATYIFKLPLLFFNSIVKFFGSFPFIAIKTDGKLTILLTYILCLAIFIAILTHDKKRDKDGKTFLFLSWGSVVIASLLGI